MSLVRPFTLYNLLFAAAAQTVLTFGRNNLGAQLGLTAVLHTWSQTLMDHYHLHCIVTGGGPTPDGKSWLHSRPDYLFAVGALSQVFRAVKMIPPARFRPAPLVRDTS